MKLSETVVARDPATGVRHFARRTQQSLVRMNLYCTGEQVEPIYLMMFGPPTCAECIRRAGGSDGADNHWRRLDARRKRWQ